MIMVLLGGRAAEEIVFHERTSGAGNDLEKATDIARKMVCEWGMSDVVGPVKYGYKEEEIFLGRDISRHKEYSEETAVKIDNEVEEIVSMNYERAKSLLEKNVDLLNSLAEVLLDKEVVDAKELDNLVKSLRPDETSQGQAAQVRM